MESSLIDLLLGELGGTMAISAFIGAASSFGFCQRYFEKNILEPHLQHCEESIAQLNSRITQLEEKEEEYITLLKAHSGLLEKTGYVIK